MDIYDAGSDITITLNMTLDTVEALTQITYLVKNEDDEEVQGLVTFVPTSGVTSIPITIPGAANTLPVNTLFAGRTMLIKFYTSATEYQTVAVDYILRGNTILAVPTSSFQTYNQANVTSFTMTGLSHWFAAGRSDREVAMIEAHRRLTKYQFSIYNDPEGVDNFTSTTYPFTSADLVTPAAWSVMTSQTFLSLPERFRTALKQAQLAEANDILTTGTTVEEKRNLGILSETIGESSMMFRMGKPATVGLSSAAMKYLSGYLNLKVVTTRT